MNTSNSGASTLGTQWKREAQKNSSGWGTGVLKKQPGVERSLGSFSASSEVTQGAGYTGRDHSPGSWGQADVKDQAFEWPLSWTRTSSPKDGRSFHRQTGLGEQWCAQWKWGRSRTGWIPGPAERLGPRFPGMSFPPVPALAQGLTGAGPVGTGDLPSRVGK